MDLSNCFVEHTGNVWKVETLINASAKLSVFKFYLDKISLEYPIAWHLTNIRDIINHFNRIDNANLRTPIILRPDGRVMNGWHRIIKAMAQNKKYVLAKQFTESPPPDFILPTNDKNVLRII